MKSLRTDEANVYLKRIGMEIGNRNQITGLQNYARINWISDQAPKEAQDLYAYAKYVAGWPPRGDWKILQADNSTVFSPDQACFIGSLLFGLQIAHDFMGIADCRAFLFEFGDDKELNEEQEVQLASLIFAFLLFESHCHIVSSASDQGQMLEIQDGFVYFKSRGKDGMSGARSFVKNLGKPFTSPPLIAKIDIDWQDRTLSSD